MRYFTSFCTKFENQSNFYTYSTSQFALATSHMLNGHRGPVAAILDRTSR